MRVTVRGLNHRLRGVVTVFGISLAIITAVAGVLAYSNKNAQAAVPPDSCFTMSGGTITAYSTAAGCPKNVDIPSTIGGVTVTGIGTQAFFNKALTAVSIPSTVTSIGSMAFYLNQITSLPAYFSNPSVTTIPQYAFGSNRFTSLTIPANITTIESGAFMSNQLTSMTIPNTVISLGSQSFAYNASLTSFTVQGDPVTIQSGVLAGNNSLTTISYGGTAYTSANPNDDTCFTVSGGTITGFLKADLANIKANGQACLSAELVIPSSIGGTTITSLANSSLSSKGFTTVAIPSTITSINSYSLYGNKLTEVIVPASVTSIGDYALYNNQITQATFQGSPTTVGANILRNNPVQSLTYAGTTYTPANSPIDESCFEFNSTTGVITGILSADPATVKATGKACMSLQLVVPAEIGGVQVTEITGGFQNIGLTSVDIPSTITKVSSYAFTGNAIVIPEMPSWTPSDITSLLTQPANITIDGVPMTISTSLSAGSTTGTHIDAVDYILHRFDDKWYPGQWQADSRITSGRTMTVEVEGDFSKLEDFSVYVSDAEQTPFRVYGFDADGNRVDVTDWVVTDQRADDSGPAIRPNPHTVLADSIEFGNPTAPGSVNDDTMRVRIQGVPLASLKKFVIEFTSQSTGDWVEWGFLGRAPAPAVDPVDPTDPEVPNIPDTKAPNAGVGSSTQGFAAIAGMLLLVSIGVVAVLRRRGTV
ncbi:MAG TPA: leucine-rich repeat domain-containing protein [Candidatus Saccharibacteria bacterium]|nr:leucine-rich repeat domain-containing protein [Candidatus Saccharibacteria bacterium]